MLLYIENIIQTIIQSSTKLILLVKIGNYISVFSFNKKTLEILYCIVDVCTDDEANW